MEFTVKKLVQVGTVSTSKAGDMTPVEAAAKLAGKDFDESLTLDAIDVVSTYEFRIEDLEFSVTFVSHSHSNDDR